MTDSEPKEFVLAGVVMKRLVSGKQTDGLFCLFENRSGGQTKTPIHVHADDDETVYVIEGQLTAIVDGEARTLSSGESIFLRRGVPHQLMNPGDRPVRYILIGSPSMFEQFLAEGGHELREGDVAGPPTPADIERLKAAAPKFGITLLRDWPARSSSKARKT
ncbi:mannose-6-phosphate isomerase-like protein (cupin superfamily) [Rhizobium sp. BK275]|uniref:cupin domain-containing protein n=1 Tax=Rhizobium sp. BK275 TaxID=2587077 RepID=UPI0016222664|nr:cupin domain-containing protein [Rhizobium sp. BK275]MBB3392789.1 mannose-6-phosphate isomerase-like protein (cupin superfamily) [Rhizobium sp. BK275]